MTSQRRETGNPSAEVPDGPFLLYDGDCPFCSFYVAKSRFETAIGRPLRLVDGREAPDLVAQLRHEGCDLEQGMILVLDGRRYPGPEAMTVLEGMSAAGRSVSVGLRAGSRRAPSGYGASIPGCAGCGAPPCLRRESPASGT